MPNQSVTLNGFKGGLNQDKDEADLSIKENAECAIAQEVLLDEPGKIVSDHIIEAASTEYNAADVTQTTASTTLAIKDDKVYQEQGVYIVGDNVNYSGLADYQAIKPQNGTAYQGGETALSAVSNGADVRAGYNQESHTVLFLGKSASVNGTGKCTIMAGGGSADATGQSLQGPGIYPEPRGYLRWSSEWDSNGDGTYIDTSVDTHDTWSDLNVFGTGASGDVHGHIYRDDDHGASIGELTINTTNPVTVTTGTCIGFDKSVSGGLTSSNAWGVIFKTGMNWTSGSQETAGYYGGGIDIGKRDIFLEIGMIDIGSQDILVVLDSNPVQTEFTTPPATTSAYCRTYVIDNIEQEASGCIAAGIGKGRVRIPYQSFAGTGASFDPHSVTRVAVIVRPVSANWGNTLAAGTDICDIWEISFGPSRYSNVMGLVSQATSGWLGNKYNLHLTEISAKGIESLPRAYMDPDNPTDRFVFDTTTYLGALFTVRQPGSTWNGRLYYERLDNAGSGTGTLFELCEISSTDGLKKVGTDSFIDWDPTLHRSVAFDEPPTARTFRLNTGYPEKTNNVNALWKYAAVVGRQAYIGNVKQPTTAPTYDVDRILKASPGKAAGFSNLEYIDLELGGAAITSMMSSGDRLFIWTTSKLIILNVANDLEYMEAELDGYGINGPHQACQVAEGIAFQNNSGLFLFDGNQFKEPDNGFVSTLNWGDGGITYTPHRKLLTCFIDILGDGVLHAYHYSLRTNTWVGTSSPSTNINAPLTNSAVGSDGKSHYYGNNLDANGQVVAPKGIVNLGTVNESLANLALVQSGKIHCGNIARKKKFKAISISNVNGGWQVRWKVDEGSWSGYSSLSDGLNRIKLTGATGYYIRVELAQVNAAPNSEIGDITVIYRDKTLK